MSIRSERIKHAARNRECINCGQTIRKGSFYFNREIRYDGTIITYSYCLSDTCSPYPVKELLEKLKGGEK